MRYTNMQETEVFMSCPPPVMQSKDDPEVNYYFIGQLRGIVVSMGINELVIDDWLRFKSFVKAWKAERGATSSITQSVLCPSYQSIIGMGEKAIPLIVSQLSIEGDDPDQWFWALQAISGKNPTKPEDQGNYKKMAQSWMKWAESEWYGR